MRLRSLICCSLAFAVCVPGPGRAQQPTPRDSQFERDIASLKEVTTTLQVQQRQIVEQLNELKQMLGANPGVRTTPSLPPKVDLQNEQFRGNDDAQLAIVEYADYECPYCGAFMRQTYPQLVRDYLDTGKVKYFFRDLPLPMHSHAMAAARAARCAGEQDKYWEMHDSLFARQSSLTNKSLSDPAVALGLDTVKFEECLSSTRYLDDIHSSMAEAQKLGVTGTPTFFLGTISPDGGAVNVTKVIRGALAYETFKAALDALLAAQEP